MSTLQRLRTGLRLDRVDDRLPGLRAGLVAATITWSAVLLFVALGWGASASGTADFAEAVGFASAAWLLAHGSAVTAGSATISLTPLGLWLGALWVTLRTLERGRDSGPDSGRDSGHDPDAVAWGRFSADFVGGYAVAILLAALLTGLGPARPTIVGLLVALGLPVAVLAVELARALVREDDRLPARAAGIPVWVVRGVEPAARGLGALGALSAVVLLVALLARWDAVTGLYGAVAPGLIGGLLLTLGQLFFVPNLGVWALAVLAGSGFQVTAGGHIGLDGSHPGLLPMLPVLGLIPPDGEYPGWTKVALALPVIVGLLVGRWADGQWSRLGSWRVKALSAGVAVGLLGVVTCVLAALATGSAGSGRLDAVGPAPVITSAALTGLVALGALLWFAWTGLTTRFATGRG